MATKVKAHSRSVKGKGNSSVKSHARKKDAGQKTTPVKKKGHPAHKAAKSGMGRIVKSMTKDHC
jgi:hypothetical protein